MDKNTVELIVNLALSGLLAYLKSVGMAEEEAKILLAKKISQIEHLRPLPTD